MKNLPHLPHLPRSKLSEKRISFEVCGSLVDLNLPRICRTCRICPRRGRFRDEMDARSEPFLALATVCLRLSVLSIHELMYKCINVPMFLSRGDMSGSQSQVSGRPYHSHPFDKLRAGSSPLPQGRGDFRAPRWCILIWDWLCERANYAKMGMRNSAASRRRRRSPPPHGGWLRRHRSGWRSRVRRSAWCRADRAPRHERSWAGGGLWHYRRAVGRDELVQLRWAHRRWLGR